MTMLARHNPQDAYRRVDFDARVNGCDPMELVGLCYEHLIAALGSAMFAHERGDNATKSADPGPVGTDSPATGCKRHRRCCRSAAAVLSRDAPGAA